MPFPAENVLLVYSRATRGLQRIIIPDFKHQESFPEWVTPANGEAMIKVPMRVFQLWSLDTSEHIQRKCERYVQQNAP